MSNALLDTVEAHLRDIDAAGTRKHERLIVSAQNADIDVRIPLTVEPPLCPEVRGTQVARQLIGEEAPTEKRGVVNFCANNYLGLANDPRLITAAKNALDTHGFGMASVRFICGTQDLHRQLEQRLADYLDVDDTIVFPSCFDANGGLFEPLLDDQDAVISDSLNHASIIDGIRLCKAKRFRYANNDMDDLEAQLIAAQSNRHRLIVTDGVFSMDGTYARLPEICDLAEKYDALVMVDDCHATGFTGARGAGTPEHFDIEGRVHILTGTFGKALGGASGGYVAGPAPIIDLLRQRARPYLFSNAIAPAVCAASLAAIDIAEAANDARALLKTNAQRFRTGLTDAGFTLIDGEHPIIPVMIGDAAVAARFADALLGQGIYVIAFSYPVVPQGMARIRTQMSASHTEHQIDRAIDAFTNVGRTLNLIPNGVTV